MNEITTNVKKWVVCYAGDIKFFLTDEEHAAFLDQLLKGAEIVPLKSGEVLTNKFMAIKEATELEIQEKLFPFQVGNKVYTNWFQVSEDINKGWIYWSDKQQRYLETTHN
jgi:hypothetical protein